MNYRPTSATSMLLCSFKIHHPFLQEPSELIKFQTTNFRRLEFGASTQCLEALKPVFEPPAGYRRK